MHCDKGNALERTSAHSILDVQIICIDSYMATPTAVDCRLKSPYNIFEEPLNQVPVVRIFGATRSRQRICLHIHQIWPYILIRYEGPHDISSVRKFGYQLGLSLNHALNIALQSNGTIFVAAVIPVKGIPFYGYHAGYRPFLKILLSNPRIVSRATALLASGAVMGRKTDVFESHLPYTLQFLVDYNLYGMEWINLRNVLFRAPPPSDSEAATSERTITDISVAAEHRWVQQGVPNYLSKLTPPGRICRSELEADTVASDIINRQRVAERRVHHKLIEKNQNIKSEILVHSLSIIWADENKRRMRQGMSILHPKCSQRQPYTPHLTYKGVGEAAQSKLDGPRSADDMRWSNHWRAQSMLQSVLANDRKNQSTDHAIYSNSTQENCCAPVLQFDTGDTWMQSWPSYRDVDIGDVLLSLGGSAGRDRFYVGKVDNVLLSQHSGIITSQSSLTNNSVFKGAATGECKGVLLQSPGPVFVDADLICNSDAKKQDERACVTSDSETENHVYCSSPFGADGKSESSNNHILNEFDDAWIADELLQIEREYLSNEELTSTEIPQLDGASDFQKSDLFKNDSSDDKAGDSSERSKRKRNYSSCSDRRRRLRPLTLLSSKTGAIVGISDEDKSAGGKDEKTKRNSYRGQRNKVAGKTEKQSRCAPYRSRAVSSIHPKVPNWLNEIEDKMLMAGQALPNANRQTNGFPKSDVFIDIPHSQGSIIASRKTSQIVYKQTACDARNTDERNDIHFHGSVSLPVYLEGHSCCKQSCMQTETALDSIQQAQLTGYHGFFRYILEPPSIAKLRSSLKEYAVAETIAQKPYFSNPLDMPKTFKAYSGSTLWISSNYAHQLSVFNPKYTVSFKGGCGNSSSNSSNSNDSSVVHDKNDFQMQNTQRRCTMWSHEAIKQINAISRSNRYNDSGCWHEGWWQFAQLPPRLSKRQHQRRSLPDQRVVAKKKGDDGANGLSRSKDSPISTPIARRKRDQSDIKWNAVLGSLLQPHSSTQFKGDNYNSIEKLQTESKTAEEKELVFLSQVSMELLVMCQGESAIDPKRDMIMCIVVCHLEDWQRNEQSWGSVGSNGCRNYRTVVWSCSPVVKLWRLGLPSHVEHRCCENELDMIMDMSKCICQTDPDILCGYDLQGGSWGYLIERTELVYGIHICNALSRISNTGIYRQQQQTGPEHKNESCNHYKGIEIDIVGRHTLNVWKIMRSELNITSYTFENVVAKVLGERSPHYSPATLSSWVSEGPVVAQARALRHVLYRAAAVLRILEKARIVDRAAEFASVIGIDFQSVLTRGSQFRVESLMARIAHPELYILSSPTRGQVAQQHAAECLPLVLEPQSRYYTDPVVVLDFQSLYPSMMIAYNYCFSTCLGRLEEAASVPASVSILSGDSGSSRRLGFTSFDMPSGLLAALGHSNITVSPNGVMFVKPSVRKGLLGRMLQEILESRVMIKEAISLWGKDDKPLYKKLDAWQLGLKLIANVTYGYTGASFSGRMPCVDVADAIVQAGRETLENAIKFVHTRHSTWGAEVVYGDTDSMFLHFPGKSRESAIRIGHEIAEAVTNLNPAPVKLNFEKVYQPCVLLTKKRYVGWMYSSVDQAEPQLDVKGMELVRRDGCGVQQRILEGAIDIMFRKNDLSLVKSFVTQQITKVLRGEVPLEEFIIAKEVRMGTYSGRTLPAHVKVAVDNMAYDMQAEPQYGERVPYVVVSNGICSRLNDQVVRPHMLLKRADLRLNAQYYIEKQITPALDRVFSLMGVDVRAWIDKMPKRLRSSIYNVLTDGDSESENDPIIEPPDIHQMLRPQPLYIQAAPPDQLISGRTEARGSRKHMSRTLDHFYLKRSCILCTKAVAAVPSSPGGSGRTAESHVVQVCDDCMANRAIAIARVGAIRNQVSSAFKEVLDKCADCVGGHRADALHAAEACESIDCSNLFQRDAQSRRYLAWSKAIRDLDN